MHHDDTATPMTLHTLPMPIAVPSGKPSAVELSALEFNLDSDDAELTVTLDIAVNSADCITDVAALGVAVTVPQDYTTLVHKH